MILWAVHIPDNLLTEPWVAGGFAGAAALAVFAAWRLREEEIPRIALLTAAFFVASSIHVPLGPSSAHLLLNGLVGIVLGQRAPLAILVGVTLQALLLQHGGTWTIGVNTCDMALPALLARGLYSTLRRFSWTKHAWFRAALVAVSAGLWTLTLIYAGLLLAAHAPWHSMAADPNRATDWTFHPLTLAIVVAIAALAAEVERRLENQPEFALGLLVGEFAVLATLVCYCLVLVFGAKEDFRGLAVLTLLVHMPIAAVEATILGFTVGYLARVKPELLGERTEEETPCEAETVA
jgi:cobalt/nickel transport system permease protein